jgi:hypothetical protein
MIVSGMSFDCLSFCILMHTHEIELSKCSEAQLAIGSFRRILTCGQGLKDVSRVWAQFYTYQIYLLLSPLCMLGSSLCKLPDMPANDQHLPAL